MTNNIVWFTLIFIFQETNRYLPRDEESIKLDKFSVMLKSAISTNEYIVEKSYVIERDEVCIIIVVVVVCIIIVVVVVVIIVLVVVVVVVVVVVAAAAAAAAAAVAVAVVVVVVVVVIIIAFHCILKYKDIHEFLLQQIRSEVIHIQITDWSDDSITPKNTSGMLSTFEKLQKYPQDGVLVECL